jgi:chromosome segregation ATPase
MAKSHRKNRAKKESKTDKLNRISGEWRRIQEKLDETNSTITSLEAQYQADATSRQAYQKSTYQELSAAYDKRDALGTEIEQKQAEYNAIEAELESSSDDESKKSGGSKVFVRNSSEP